jgi:hypothetical protein
MKMLFELIVAAIILAGSIAAAELAGNYRLNGVTEVASQTFTTARRQV